MKRKTFKINFIIYPKKSIYAKNVFAEFKKHYQNKLHTTAGPKFITRLRRKKQILIKLKYNVR